MLAFIFESIGTSELILVGVVALIFLGPRRLPDLAKKAGKIMSEFRGTANEFKETWRREVDFEEEKKALRLDDADDDAPVGRKPTPAMATADPVEVPAVRPADPSLFSEHAPPSAPEDEPETRPGADDKVNWL